MSRPRFKLMDFDLSPGFRVIEAGAGSGKTYNLVRIVLRLLTREIKHHPAGVLLNGGTTDIRHHVELLDDLVDHRLGGGAGREGETNPKALHAAIIAQAKSGCAGSARERPSWSAR